MPVAFHLRSLKHFTDKIHCNFNKMPLKFASKLGICLSLLCALLSVLWPFPFNLLWPQLSKEGEVPKGCPLVRVQHLQLLVSLHVHYAASAVHHETSPLVPYLDLCNPRDTAAAVM